MGLYLDSAATSLPDSRPIIETEARSMGLFGPGPVLDRPIGRLVRLAARDRPLHLVRAELLAFELLHEVIRLWVGPLARFAELCFDLFVLDDRVVRGL